MSIYCSHNLVSTKPLCELNVAHLSTNGKKAKQNLLLWKDSLYIPFEEKYFFVLGNKLFMRALLIA